MAIDFNKPVKTDNYDTGFLASVRAHVVALACMLDPAAPSSTTTSNLPSGAKRLNTSTGVFEQWNGASWAEIGTAYVRNQGPNTYGSIAVAGSTGGWAGVQFTAFTDKWTYMVRADGFSGMHALSIGWRWAFDEAGALIYGTVPWGRISAAPAITGMTADAGISADSVARRTSSGYLFANYFYQNSSDGENPTVSQVLVTNGGDNYFRKASVAHLSASITPSWTNVSGRPTALSAFTNDLSALTVPVFTAASGANGSAVLRYGGSARTGYVEFYAGSGGSRQGYVGYSDGTGSTDTGTLNYVGGSHAFNGPVVSTGQVRGNGGSKGLGAITVTTTTGTPTGGADGDFVLVY